jgi:hypothetical protein
MEDHAQRLLLAGFLLRLLLLQELLFQGLQPGMCLSQSLVEPSELAWSLTIAGPSGISLRQTFQAPMDLATDGRGGKSRGQTQFLDRLPQHRCRNRFHGEGFEVLKKKDNGLPGLVPMSTLQTPSHKGFIFFICSHRHESGEFCTTFTFRVVAYFQPSK